PGNITFLDKVESNLPQKYGKIQGESLHAYKLRCDSFYHTWLKMLQELIHQHKVSKDFVPYAKAELSSRYIEWVAGPAAIIPVAEFPKHYFSLPDSLQFKNENFILSLPNYGN